MMSDVEFRSAVVADLPAVVALLADDTLGATREVASDPVREEYATAFDEIVADLNNEIIVAVHEGKVVGTLQLTYIPNLTLLGSKRALIEGVRVAASLRGRGVGKKMVLFALKRSRERGCKLAQLTTNKKRPEARAFYESLGFNATHEGMKLVL